MPSFIFLLFIVSKFENMNITFYIFNYEHNLNYYTYSLLLGDHLNKHKKVQDQTFPFLNIICIE